MKVVALDYRRLDRCRASKHAIRASWEDHERDRFDEYDNNRFQPRDYAMNALFFYELKKTAILQ